jgi:capsular exopolysaccharide synthesis family protein
MGRVFEALKRASAQTGAPQSRTSQNSSKNSTRSSRSVPGGMLPAAKEIEEQLMAGSSILSASNAAYSSASTAHTANAPDGSALPDGIASRAAGATLGAAGPARAAEFMSYTISAARVEPHLVAVTQPRSAYNEQFRSLRTRILQAGEHQQMRTFVVTSSGIGEGKTLTALNLAWLLAQTDGVRALIIDSDLRRPCATQYFGLDLPVGLSEVLSGDLSFEEAVVRLEPAGLYLLPGGSPRDDVAELLSGPTYARVLKEARRVFDYVIIDAPPLGIFTDASLLIDKADGALLVVRAGKTRYAMLDRLLDQLPRERMLGVVLNRVDEQLDGSNYYYRHDYYTRGRRAIGNGAQSADQPDEEVALVS